MLEILAPTQAIISTTQISSIIVAEPINEPETQTETDQITRVTVSESVPTTRVTRRKNIQAEIPIDNSKKKVEPKEGVHVKLDQRYR